MRNTMEYKGYIGSVEFSEEDGVFFGSVMGIRSLISYEGTNAKELVDEVGEILGSTLSNLACVVNPEVIVIGGGVSKAGTILIDTVQEHFKENALYALKETRFELATLGNDAGMYGCVKMILG